ncbi:MAG: zinc ribbon domain-containing protein, partial [Acidobacteria bacterium]|nr:zinc ribbon domain-containing protein [Acidobacteriota bacterium]
MPSERAYQRVQRPLVARIAVGAVVVMILCVADAPLTANLPGSSESPSSAHPAPSGDTSNHLYCPVCGAQNRAGNRFCLKDGSPLPRIIPARLPTEFIRSPGTYSPKEIQQVMQQVTESVVRIRARTTTTYKYPIAYWKDEEAEYFGRAMRGKIETSNTDARLTGSGFVISA